MDDMNEDKLDKLINMIHKMDVRLARLEERQSSQAKFWGFLGGFFPALAGVLSMVFIKR